VSRALAIASVALGFAGCAVTEAPRPGELELVVDPQASYALIGRFQIHAIQPWSPSRDVDFDTGTSAARVALPAGSFTLALGAGARLVCAGEDAGATALPAAARLVSASPRVFSIEPGRVTTARIGFGRAPASLAGERQALSPGEPDDGLDPCGTSFEIAELASPH